MPSTRCRAGRTLGAQIHLFIGKSGALLYGIPDTTQDVDLFPLRNPKNAKALVKALGDIDEAQTREIEQGK